MRNPAQVDLHSGRPDQALYRLDIDPSPNLAIHIRRLLLVARAEYQQGRQARAYDTARRAVEAAQPDRYIRPLVEDPLQTLPLLQGIGAPDPYLVALVREAEQLAPPVSPPDAVTLLEPLTEREGQILRHLPSHLTLRQIGLVMCLSTNTVKTHVKSIYRKIGAMSRDDAVSIARRHGSSSSTLATTRSCQPCGWRAASGAAPACPSGDPGCSGPSSNNGVPSPASRGNSTVACGTLVAAVLRPHRGYWHVCAKDGAMPLDDITVARPHRRAGLGRPASGNWPTGAPTSSESRRLLKRTAPGCTGEAPPWLRLSRTCIATSAPWRVDLEDAGRSRGSCWRLAETADVLVENMRPPVKDRLGFDYDTRSTFATRGSSTARSRASGRTDPIGERGGIDQVAQGMGGLMSVTGMPGTEPARVGIPISDLAAGLYLAVGILVALHDRERTGEGRWVQTSLLESMIGMMDFQATRWTVDGDIPIQEGNHHPTLVPMGCFRTADGHINVAGSAGRLLGAALRGDRARPAHRATRGSTRRRSDRRTGAELNATVSPSELRTRTTAEWIESVQRRRRPVRARVPAGRGLR